MSGAGTPLPACREAATPPPSPLAAAAHPAITLPASDMAEPVSPGALDGMLALRVPQEGYLPAVWLPSGEEVAVADAAARKNLLVRAASRDREPVAPELSRLEVLIWADRDASWQRVRWAIQDCADPDVRVDRLRLAATDAAGNPGTLPLRLPDDGCPRSDLDVLRLPVEIVPEPIGDGFADTVALYRWCYARWLEAAGRAVLLEIAADASVPFHRCVEVLNEARRFGFFVSFPWGRSSPPGERSEWFFRVPPDTRPAGGSVPPLRPGLVLGRPPAGVVLVDVLDVEVPLPIEERLPPETPR